MYWDIIWAQTHGYVNPAASNSKNSSRRREQATAAQIRNPVRRKPSVKANAARRSWSRPSHALNEIADVVESYTTAATSLADSAWKKTSSLTKRFSVSPWLAKTAAIAVLLLLAALTVSSLSATEKTATVPEKSLSEIFLPEVAGDFKSAESAHLQFSQSGEPWSWLPYWGGTIAENGCGLCSYTSAVDILTGASYTPTDMLDLRGDWYGMDAYTDDTTGTDGRTHAQWTYDTFGLRVFQVQCSIDALNAAVSRGDCVAVVCTRGAVFMDNAGGVESYDGHFVCVWGVDEQGCFRVHDSAVPHGFGTDVHYSPEEMQNMIDYSSSITVYQRPA